MKKLLLLATTVLTLTCLTNCNGGADDKDSSKNNSSGGAPDSLMGKTFRMRQWFLMPTGWVDIARKELDTEFVTDTLAIGTYTIYNSSPPYAPIRYITNVAGNYVYRKTGPNTAYCELSSDAINEVYRYNMTISGNRITGTGTRTEGSEIIQLKVEGRFIK